MTGWWRRCTPPRTYIPYMPRVPAQTLPDSARVWVFGADRALEATEAERLLGAVDTFLDGWAAHGELLTSARELRDGRFLMIAVDTRQAAASGCSIDALFRALQDLERELGFSILGGGRVYWRDPSRAITCVQRADAGDAVAAGDLTPDTVVFDPAVDTLGAWRTRFETRASDSWHAALLGAANPA